MARIRTIKPETTESESMGRVSRDARLVFILMWTVADDTGRLRGSSRLLASELCPYDDDAQACMENWLVELEREHCIERYSVEGNTYIQVCNWFKHQKIDHPTPSKLPPPDGAPSRDLASNSRDAPNSSPGIGSGSGSGSGPPYPLTPSPQAGKGNGAKAQGRRPRNIRAASALAWGHVLNAAQHGGGSAGDPVVDEAVRRIGGYTRLSQANTSQRGINRERFREAYEHLLDKLALQMTGSPHEPRKEVDHDNELDPLRR
jgi:hypothetical protein